MTGGKWVRPIFTLALAKRRYWCVCRWTTVRKQGLQRRKWQADVITEAHWEAAATLWSASCVMCHVSCVMCHMCMCYTELCGAARLECSLWIVYFRHPQYWCPVLRTYINQSINQASISPISPAKPGSVAQQPNQCSTAKLRKQFRNINRPLGSDGIYGGKAKSKRYVFRCFLKVVTELAERTDSGRLFQRDGAQALAPVLVLTLGTDKLLSLFDLSEREGIDAASMEWR